MCSCIQGSTWSPEHCVESKCQPCIRCGTHWGTPCTCRSQTQCRRLKCTQDCFGFPDTRGRSWGVSSTCHCSYALAARYIFFFSLNTFQLSERLGAKTLATLAIIRPLSNRHRNLCSVYSILLSNAKRKFWEWTIFDDKVILIQSCVKVLGNGGVTYILHQQRQQQCSV